MTQDRLKEIAEQAISFLQDQELLDEFLEDRDIELDEEEKQYFCLNDEDDSDAESNPCFNCGYHWQEEWEDYPSCHYDGPHEWSPCEQADEDERRRREREEYEEFVKQESEYWSEDEMGSVDE